MVSAFHDPSKHAFNDPSGMRDLLPKPPPPIHSLTKTEEGYQCRNCANGPWTSVTASSREPCPLAPGTPIVIDRLRKLTTPEPTPEEQSERA